MPLMAAAGPFCGAKDDLSGERHSFEPFRHDFDRRRGAKGRQKRTLIVLWRFEQQYNLAFVPHCHFENAGEDRLGFELN
jgi:hypothetical protein